MRDSSKLQHGLKRVWNACLLLAVGLISVPAIAAPGPDVTVFALPNITNHGATNGIRGYSVGTTSCNVGTIPLNWCDAVAGCGAGTQGNDHPVIAQNIYRLKNGRMDQIGASWLKHGFLSLNQSAAGCGSGSCQSPPLGGDQLGVGCTDPYDSGLNGSRPLGRRSEVDPSTGDYPFPFTQGGATAATWNQRVAVAEADLTTANNPGARYFVEGHYVAPDDASAGNGLNNASYREVTVNQTSFALALTGATVREKSALEAWPTIDNTVLLVNVDLRGSPTQRLHVARKVTEVTPGQLWHYEYAIHNMNATKAADRFSVRFFDATTITAVGFHDVNAHSNEPYDTADWPGVTTGNSVTWETPAFPSSPANANALRWGTTYNFWFDANRGPEQIQMHSLRSFTDGADIEFLGGVQEQPMFANGFEN